MAGRPHFGWRSTSSCRPWRPVSASKLGPTVLYGCILDEDNTQRHTYGHTVKLVACSCKAFQASFPSSASASDQKFWVVRASLLRVFTLLKCSAVFVLSNVWFVRCRLSDSGNPPAKSRAVVYDIGHANAREEGARGEKVLYEMCQMRDT